MPDAFSIRRAKQKDAEIIAWHRARMFQDMGEIISGDAFEILRTKTRALIKEWLANGDYAGWLASPADKPGLIVWGARLQMQTIPPRPLRPAKKRGGRQR